VDDPVAGPDGIPIGRNFSFSNVRLKDATELCECSHISTNRPLDGLTLANIAGNCSKGISLANITNASLSNIQVTGYKGDLLKQENVQGTGLDLQ
jgi:hypothetical protein